jgi:pyruvate formate lyase activating enzyme
MKNLLKLYKIERFCLHDGPGIRSTVFLKGCMNKCPWCHNPESLSPNPELMIHNYRCLLTKNPPLPCSKPCLSSCSHSALKLKNEKIFLERSKCEGAFDCVPSCPTEVFEKIGFSKTPEEVMKQLIRDEAFYKTSGGGITASGGEPLLQAQILSELLKLCKERDYHTLVETSGQVSWKQGFQYVLPYVDEFYIDIKGDAENYKKLTGNGIELLMTNVKKLLAEGYGEKVEMRMPVIPGYNDTPQIVEGIADSLSQIGKQEVTLLTYNKLGEPKLKKWKQSKHL